MKYSYLNISLWLTNLDSLFPRSPSLSTDGPNRNGRLSDFLLFSNQNDSKHCNNSGYNVCMDTGWIKDGYIHDISIYHGQSTLIYWISTYPHNVHTLSTFLVYLPNHYLILDESISTRTGKSMLPMFCEYEVKKLRSSACSRLENTIFSPHIHTTWEAYFCRSLYSA